MTRTTVVESPIPIPLIADVVTASVGHIPKHQNKSRIFFIIPFIIFQQIVFISTTPLMHSEIAKTAVLTAPSWLCCNSCTTDASICVIPLRNHLCDTVKFSTVLSYILILRNHLW